MRGFLIGFPVLAAMLMPSTGTAQVYQLPTPAPVITMAEVPRRSPDQPIYYAGGLYYPAGPTEFFDGQIMARTGVIDGLPVYENKTLEPWSVLFVPIGGNLMQPYERRRSGALVGTVGSRTPALPIQRDVELSAVGDSLRDGDLVGFPPSTSSRAQWTWPTPAPAVEAAPPLGPLAPRTKMTGFSVPVIRAVPRRETTNAGIYVDFAGAHHYSSGKAVKQDEAKFTRIGELGGAAVFRELGGSEKTIHVAAVADGLLAPYTRP
jgi:hypothetical protein